MGKWSKILDVVYNSNNEYQSWGYRVGTRTLGRIVYNTETQQVFMTAYVNSYLSGTDATLVSTLFSRMLKKYQQLVTTGDGE